MSESRIPSLPWGFCCCGDNCMDTGAFSCSYYPWTQAYPLPCHITSEISTHLAAGSQIKFLGPTESPDDDYYINHVFLPGSEHPKLLCTLKITEQNGLATHDSNGHTAYTSPVYTGMDKSVAGLYAMSEQGEPMPPHRWTGRSRLWAQAKAGAGKILYGLCDPDMQGLLMSDDGTRYYRAHIPYDGSPITIAPLKLKTRNETESDCLTSILSQARIPQADRDKLLAHILSLLEIDNSRSSYTIDSAIPTECRAPLSYGWHWAYNDNRCSAVLTRTDNSEAHPEWLKMQLVTLTFSVPGTPAPGVPEQPVTVNGGGGEIGEFSPDYSSSLWTRAYYNGAEMLVRQWCGPTGTPIGTGCPVYCL